MRVSVEKKVIYAFLCLGCVTISFNVSAIIASIPAISADLKLPDFLVSKIIPYYMIPYGIGAFIYAPLTRIVSYRKVMVLTMALYGLACYFCGTITGINQFLLARIAMGISGASAIPLGLMIIGDFFERSIRGRLVGVFFGCSFFASLAGVLLSGFADWRWLFFVPAIMGLLLAAGYAFFNSPLLNKIHQASINYLRVFTDLPIRKVFIFIAVISALYHGVHKWFGVYLSRIYHLDQLTISTLFIVIAIGGFTGQMIGGVISDKKTRTHACYTGLFLLSLGTMLLWGHYSLIILSFILFIIAMGWTIGHNGISTVLTDFPENDRPIISSLNSSIRFIFGGLGFYISGFFVQQSFGLTFFAIGILILSLSIILKYIIPK